MDGIWRMCVNYKELTKFTIRNSYTLPRTANLIDRLQGANIDLRTSYHHIRIAEEDISHYGHYEFMVLPFGLTYAPAISPQLMNDTFLDELGHFIIVFLDDILIYNKMFQDHAKHVMHSLRSLEIISSMQ